MPALINANRKRLLLSVGLCCLPCAAFGMDEVLEQVKKFPNKLSSVMAPHKLKTDKERESGQSNLKIIPSEPTIRKHGFQSGYSNLDMPSLGLSSTSSQQDSSSTSSSLSSPPPSQSHITTILETVSQSDVNLETKSKTDSTLSLQTLEGKIIGSGSRPSSKHSHSNASGTEDDSETGDHSKEVLNQALSDLKGSELKPKSKPSNSTIDSQQASTPLLINPDINSLSTQQSLWVSSDVLDMDIERLIVEVDEELSKSESTFNQQVPQQSATSLTTPLTSTTSTTTTSSTISTSPIHRQNPPLINNFSLSQTSGQKDENKLDEKTAQKNLKDSSVIRLESDDHTSDSNSDSDSTSTSTLVASILSIPNSYFNLNEKKENSDSDDSRDDLSDDGPEEEVLSGNKKTLVKAKKETKQNGKSGARGYNSEFDNAPTYEKSISHPEIILKSRSRRSRAPSLSLQSDDIVSNNSLPVVQIPFQRRFMSKNNPYRQPQYGLSSESKEKANGFFLSKKQKNSEKFLSRLIQMKSCCSGESAIPVKSLALAFYIETTGDNSVQALAKSKKENIKGIKPEDLLNKFWGYSFTENLAKCWGEFSPDVLELIGSSAIFLMNKMSGMTFKLDQEHTYIKNLCKTFLDCCDALSKHSQDTQRYTKYYSYYSAKYFTIIKSYEMAWPHIVKCGDFSECIDGDGRDNKFYKRELKWIRNLSTWLWVLSELEQQRVILDSLTKSKRYLEIAHVVEKINILEDNKSQNPQKTEGSIDREAANYYLKSAMHHYIYDKEQALNEMNQWDLDMLFHLARKADSLAVPSEDSKQQDSSNLLLEISNACYDIVFNVYEKDANEGDPKAQFTLGWMYENGYGVPKDFRNAAVCYELAAEQDHAEAQFSLGALYQDGEGVEQSYEVAALCYQKAANHGNVDAQYSLALLYEMGFGVQQDSAMAAKWYEDAAKQGYIEAQTRLGSMYEEGQGVEQDDVKAARYYGMAAVKGDATAQVKLGLMYKEDRGVSVNPTEAFKWCKKSADQGNAEGQFHLGWMYLRSYTVKKDSAKAVELFKASARKEYAEAQYHLGVLYEEGRIVAKSLDKAVKWYALAANQGHKKAIEDCTALAKNGHRGAQTVLGRIYEEGIGGLEDLTEALKWYEMAAAQKEATAQFYVGLMYLDGRGVEKDINRGLDYLEKAASQQNSAFQLVLGMIYEGVGEEVPLDEVPKDLDKAFKLYEASATLGNSTAQYRLAEMYSHGRGVPINFEQAFIYYRMAAKQGDLDALFKLGGMYVKGLYVPQDFKKAADCFTIAAEGEHELALYHLGLLYANGHGLEQSDDLATQCFLSATAEAPEFQAMLGTMYEEGKGLPQDTEKAILWYREAANGGSATAQYKLGGMYHNGCGVEQDIEEAVKCYSDAAKQGHVMAKDALDLMYTQAAIYTPRGQITHDPVKK